MGDESPDKPVLEKSYGITHIPCYYWLLCLLKLIKRYKEKEKSKRPISKIILDYLLDPLLLASVFSET